MVAITIWIAWIKYEIQFARDALSLPVPYSSRFVDRENYPDGFLARGGEITVVIDLPEDGHPEAFRDCIFGDTWQPAELPPSARAWSYLAAAPVACAARTDRGPTSKGSGRTIVAVQGKRLTISYYWSE